MKPPLSSLFIEVDVVDGDIATPYILGRGSLKKKQKKLSLELLSSKRGKLGALRMHHSKS